MSLFNLQPTKQTTDVIVIGSGAGGGVIAKELGEAGVSAIVLEAGRRYNPETDYGTDKQDFEVRARTSFACDDDRRDLYTTRRQNNFSYNRVKGVGGGNVTLPSAVPAISRFRFSCA